MNTFFKDNKGLGPPGPRFAPVIRYIKRLTHAGKDENCFFVLFEKKRWERIQCPNSMSTVASL